MPKNTMPDTDDKGLDANALVMKRALLAGVVDEEQNVRQQITQLQKGEGVDLAAVAAAGCPSPTQHTLACERRMSRRWRWRSKRMAACSVRLQRGLSA